MFWLIVKICSVQKGDQQDLAFEKVKNESLFLNLYFLIYTSPGACGMSLVFDKHAPGRCLGGKCVPEVPGQSSSTCLLTPTP